MKNLIFKIIVFIIPLIGWLVIEGLLPPNTFTYRPWEALDFQTPFDLDRYFHTNTELEMKSVGQLCHHTKYAITKDERWITDKIGNRNNLFVENPDILIMGDSFAAGCSVTQDSIINNLLQSELKHRLKVYNIAPCEFSGLDYYLKTGIISKPKTVVFFKSERYVPRPLESYKPSNSKKSKIKNELKKFPVIDPLSIFLDKIFRQYSVNWIRARLTQKIGDGIPGVEGSNMFFLNTEKHGYDPNMVQDFTIDLLRTKNNLVSYKKYCDSLGIDFLFVPMPNKATVYFDYVPYNEQPDYLIKLDSMLKAEDVQTINTLALYNNFRQNSNKLLYHPDDTHWNANAIQIVSEEIAEIITSNSDYLVEN
jgi:alginate O-acetyltransferase complex protein AlgJ